MYTENTDTCTGGGNTCNMLSQGDKVKKRFDECTYIYLPSARHLFFDPEPWREREWDHQRQGRKQQTPD
jgi:hypothetical protein